MTESVRKPAVSGLFYPSGRDDLCKLIEEIEDREKDNVDFSFSQNHIIGGIVPHAGYIYSGYQAIHFFLVLQNSKQAVDTVIIVNPDHRGFGTGIALDKHPVWETPLGQIEVDNELCEALEIPVSSNAHNDEHSGEVMVPFLQYYMDDNLKIAPVSLSDQSYEAADNLAHKIDKAVNETGKRTIVIASSDFSHFINPNEGYMLDNLVCEKIDKLDAEGVYETVRKNNISVCGYGPIMTLIEYSKLKHPDVKTKILRRGNSGEVSPSAKVVNYITTLFFSEKPIKSS